ncbi:MAG: hypothetical protein JO020_32575 [Chloroflexi bacterium]|nr:hypothetical protein [Chloroflexota bacterium]
MQLILDVSVPSGVEVVVVGGHCLFATAPLHVLNEFPYSPADLAFGG